MPACYRTSALQMLQKSLHRYLKQRKEFKFIGEEFNPKSCEQLRTRLKGYVAAKQTNYILNGDYSAATDHLKLDVVHTIGQVILD